MEVSEDKEDEGNDNNKTIEDMPDGDEALEKTFKEQFSSKGGRNTIADARAHSVDDARTNMRDIVPGQSFGEEFLLGFAECHKYGVIALDNSKLGMIQQS